uniref:Uncharacterized protein n=1 Tax=Catagonus wagneri TaxID=51154 RepID=A0A8C3YVY7_9CETA
MCIMTISSTGKLDLVGLMRLLFLHYVITGPESFMEGRGEKHLLILYFLMEDCILFIDTGTRVHLLDAKGLSFTQDVFICLLLSTIYLNIEAA